MAKEYIEREAAKSEFNIHFGGVSHAVIASKILDEIPAADVVEVTRFRDCWKSADGLCSYQLKYVPGKDFCGDGERRNNNG